MNVRDLLLDPRFSDLHLLAGSDGEARKISAVTVTDTPDGIKWVSGGEFVITTGYMLGNDEQKLIAMIRELTQRGAAALGIKNNRYLSSISDQVLRCADQCGLPLISIPESYAFIDLINPVLSDIINQQHEELVQADIIHTRFMELAVNERPIGDILQTLSLIIGIPAAFADLYFGKMYYSDAGSAFAQQMKNADSGQGTAERLEICDHYAVADKNHVFGHILLPKGSLEKCAGSRFQVALEQASVTLILRMHVIVSQKQMEEQYRNTLIEDILLNNIKDEQEIHNRAALYNWDFRQGGFVVFVDINHFKANFFHDVDSEKNRMLEKMATDIFDITIREMQQVFHDVKYMRQRDFAVLLVTPPAGERGDLDVKLCALFNLVRKKLEPVTTFSVSWGIGNYYDNIRDAYRSYTEARTTINLGETLKWFGRILFFKDMKLYHMLKPCLDSPETNLCCAQYIEPLIEYDRQYHLNLVTTLYELIQSNWNLKKTAENLFLHYNSMKYRYTRICSVMDLDLSLPDNRLMISLAVIIYRLGKNKQS